jgi:DNA sulfur modification protein DndE
MKNRILFFSCVLLMAAGIPEKKTRIFLIGDSTMADKPLAGNPERGWGQLLPRFLTEEAQVRNYAVNGRSTKSFIREGRWDTVMKYLQKEDYVIIQFGHNDQKIEDTNRYAAPQTTYRNNLTRFVKEARSRGAMPILVTPVMRRKFDAAGKFVDQHGEYPAVVRAVAKEMNVPLIDLHRSSQQLIEQEGVEGSKKLFLWIDPDHFSAAKEGKKDDTHFSEYGASRIAALVCADIENQHLPLERLLKPSAHPEKKQYALPVVYQPHFKRDTFSIEQFGAVKDGITLNTAAINKTIDACASKGGGTVLIPSGLWLTGPIVLKSNVELHTERGALVLFTPDHLQYPLMSGYFEGVLAARCQSPISANNAENIAITGEGIFNGSGDTWRPVKKEKLTDSEWKKKIASGGVLSENKNTWYASESALKGSVTGDVGKLVGGKKISDFEPVRDFLRPVMLQFTGCRNILLDGVTFENSPAWTLHLLMSEQITVRGVVCKNPEYGQNTDAIDLESCKNIYMSRCTFDVGDDGICIKSGRDEEGRKRGIPTENVVVEDCTVYHAHGGFVVGSEMSGGARNLFVSNCTFIGTDIGLRFKTTRGRGGIVENVYASNIRMRNIPGEAILFDMYYMAKDPVPMAGEKREMPKIETLPVNEGTPVFRNFYINNIVCNGAEKAVFIRGIPEMQISNIELNNLVMQTDKGVECTEAADIRFNKLRLVTKQSEPLINIQNSQQIRFMGIQTDNPVKLLFSVNGDRAKDIKVSGSRSVKSEKQTEFNFGASASSLIFQ